MFRVSILWEILMDFRADLDLQGKKSILLAMMGLVFLGCNSDDAVDQPAHNGWEEIEEEEEQEEEEQEEEPVQNIVWKNWYLSVPTASANGAGKATSIFYQDIEENRLSQEQAEYFYPNINGSYTMFTRFTGYTTSGPFGLDQGRFCRTELREYWQGNQDIWDNWYMDSGLHQLESTLQVNFCEGGGETFVAQIHAKRSFTQEGSPATIKVLWDNGEIEIEYYTKPDNGIWTSDYNKKVTIAKVDNEIFTIKLRVLDGMFAYGLTCEAKNIDLAYTPVYDYSSTGYDFDNYFKTGNYFRWDSDATATCQVVLHGAKTTHSY